MSPRVQPTRRPIAMLTHSYYEEDPRVRREAEAVAEHGRHVDVFALRRPGDGPREVLDGVTVRRLDVQRHQGAGIGTYAAEYLDFFVRALFSLTTAHPRRRYALVQVHTLPDALVFATLPIRLAGVPVVLDLHEAMPEFFSVRFPRLANPAAHAVLRLQERLSIGVADAAITVNEALAERLLGLGVPRSKVSVVLNSPSLARFDPGRHERRPFMADGRLRIVYAGALSPVYELDVALESLARIRRDRPELDATLELYGRDFEEVPLRALARDHGIEEAVAFHGRIAIEDVPAAIARADVGIAPTRRTAMTDFSLSTKIFEYAAMAKPVVASHLPMVERTFPADTVATYEPGDAADLAGAILSLVDDPAARDARVARTGDTVRERSWERESVRYLDLIERLARDGLSSGATAEEGS
jgi:glycosyltransferase involved in cell wall biosynthesis